MTVQSKLGVPIVLTIAGLDPSGGAGILADTRTIAAFNCYPTAAVTSITFQSAAGISGFSHQDPATVRNQILPLLRELPIACVKTGMLPTPEIVLEVAGIVREFDLRCLVVDPVMRSTSGYELMNEMALAEMKAGLLPLAHLVTPNIPEAEKLAGFSVEDEAGMRRAAELIRGGGVRAVLIKGGHLQSARESGGLTPPTEVIDVLDDQGEVTVFRGEWIGGAEFRGTGCTLASGIAAGLASGHSLVESVRRARDFLTEAMRGTPRTGRGLV